MILDQVIRSVSSYCEHDDWMNWHKEENDLTTQHVEREFNRMKRYCGVRSWRLKSMMKLVKVTIDKFQMKESMKRVPDGVYVCV